MSLRLLAIALVVISAAPGAAAQDTSDPGENASSAAALEAGGESAALDAAWSMVEARKPTEPGKTIRRRGLSGKSDSVSTGRVQPVSGSSWLRSIGSLVAVVGVILFLAWGAKSLTRGGPLMGRARRPGVIEIISRTTLSPRQSLCLVRVGPRMVLVGVTQDALRTLDVIHDPEAVAALAGEATASKAAESERAFQTSLERETVNYESFARGAPSAPVGTGLSDVRQRLSASLARVKGAAKQA